MPKGLLGLKPVPQKRMSSEEQELRDLWNAPERGEELKSLSDFPGEVRAPKSPPMFRGEQPVVGTDLSRMAEQFYKIAPNLRGKSSRMQFGPGNPAIEQLYEGGRNPEEFGILNLLGVTGLDTKEVNINPDLGRGLYMDFPPEATLAHELTHVSGYGEPTARKAGDVIRKLRGLSPRK